MSTGIFCLLCCNLQTSHHNAANKIQDSLRGKEIEKLFLITSLDDGLRSNQKLGMITLIS